MGLTDYIIQIIVSLVIITILYFLGEQLGKYALNHPRKWKYLHDVLPHEEILILKQLHYLVLILFIYIFIINFFFIRFFTVSKGLILFNSLLDVFVSIYIMVTLYDGTRRSKILNLFLMPLASLSALFGGSLLGYWNFIHIPALLYCVIKLYNKFIDFTERNQMGKLLLILVSIIFACIVLTLFFEHQNPITALSMVSNAFTSNGYAVFGSSTGGILTGTLLVWSGYIISGVATATLAAAIVHRNSKKKFERLEDKIDNLEKIMLQYHEENKKEEEK